MKKVLVATVLLLISLVIPFGVIYAEEIEKNELSVIYEYDENTNKVTAKILSNIKMKDTKPTWKLSEDGFTYIKEFSSNQTYKTNVTDINGNISTVTIEISQIREFSVEVEYEYNQKDNTVTATINSNEKLANTKPTWNLSEDKLQYSKIFKANQMYSTPVEDMWGNITNVTIHITQVDDVPPTITMEYKLNVKENEVIAIMKSNEILANTKPTWILSEDKLSYSKVFNINQKYITPVEDMWGNITNVTIHTTQVDDKGPKIEMDYEYNAETNEVTAIMKSNEILADTKPTWILSEDKLSYSKVFNVNQKYNTPVEDMWGNITNVTIHITQVDDVPPTITMEYKLNVKENEVIAIMKSNEPLADTKPTWTLSDDKLTYTKNYNPTEKQDYTTSVKDFYGNERWVKIKIQTTQYSYSNSKGPNITIKYLYDSNERVTAYIISDKKLLDTKPSWNLDSTQTIYTKIFTDNQMYNTAVKDIEGNEVTVSIIINFFKTTFKGIDVSSYQGIIDWGAVKKSGIDFAIIRVGYRGWGTGKLVTDDYFERNIKEAAKNGIDIGIYFYSQAINTDEAREEARYAISVATKYNINIKFPIVIDTEKSSQGRGRADNLSRETRTSVVKAFCNEVKTLGYTPMIYASKNWLYNNLDIQSLSQYEVWLAHYTTSTDYKYPYNIWQYTSSGTVSGINGNVDMNICYKRY